MAETFHLIVASVGETKFDGAALSATLPGQSGELTILAHHEPLVTTLKSGTITVRLPTQAGETTGEQKFDVGSGVVEVSNNRAVILL
jgi:F-type H+-transporting ATPase subunit epsilon